MIPWLQTKPYKKWAKELNLLSLSKPRLPGDFLQVSKYFLLPLITSFFFTIVLLFRTVSFFSCLYFVASTLVSPFLFGFIFHLVILSLFSFASLYSSSSWLTFFLPYLLPVFHFSNHLHCFPTIFFTFAYSLSPLTFLSFHTWLLSFHTWLLSFHFYLSYVLFLSESNPHFLLKVSLSQSLSISAFALLTNSLTRKCIATAAGSHWVGRPHRSVM